MPAAPSEDFPKMEHDNVSDKAIIARCHHLVPSLLADRDWRLVATTQEAFLNEVFLEVKHRIPRTRQDFPLDKTIEYAMRNRYNHHIHKHVLTSDSPLQHRALEETFAYLYGVSRAFTHQDDQLAQEIAQEATIAVWRVREEFRDPGTFLEYGCRVVKHAAIRRMGNIARELLLSDLTRSEEANEIVEPKGEEPLAIPGPEEEEFSEKWSSFFKRVKLAIRECLAKYRRRQEVIIRRFLLGQSLAETALAMTISPDAVSMLTSNARKILRNCVHFHALRP